MPNLSSILPPNNIVTSENEVTLTNKTIDNPVVTVNGQPGNPRQPLVFDQNGSVTFGNGDSFSIPAGGTGERPGNPNTGELRFNTDTSGLEQYDGTNWVPVVPDDIDLNSISINGTEVVDSSGNIDTASVSINGELLSDGNSIKIPTGTTGERPASPATGELRFNTDEGSFEKYDGTSWASLVPSDIDVNTLSINGSEVIDSSGNLTNIGTIEGLNYPSSDGTQGQVLTTDGSGNISFNDVSAGGGAELIATGSIPSAGTSVALRSDGTVEVVEETFLTEDIGTENVFRSSETQKFSVTYDSAESKVVIAFLDRGTNRGKAIVGTVSGSNITFGTETFFSASGSNVQRISSTYDSAESKVVIVWHDSSGDKAEAIVGTVSGSNISFGSEVTFKSGNPERISVAYDSAESKVVIGFSTDNDADGRAIVGTVFGSNITFGSEAIFHNTTTFDPNIVYDSNEGKVVIIYRDSSQNGNVIIGTVSGSDISFGSEFTFRSTGSTFIVDMVYDSNEGKVVIVYETDIDEVRAIVGTVSGSNISFGSEVTFKSGSVGDVSSVYDSVANKVVIAYRDTDLPRRGKLVVGTVSGSNITFGSEVTFRSDDLNDVSAAYDSVANKVVIAYRDIIDDKARVITYNPAYTATNANDFVGFSQDSAADTDTVLVATNQQIDVNQTGLTPQTTYYLDTDGSITTSDTGLPVAGFALDSNTLRVGG